MMPRPRRADRRLAVLAVVLLVLGCNSSMTPGPPSSSGTTVTSVSTAATASGSQSASAEASAAPEPPSAADVIEADVDAGEIDANTGILYRLEAQFGAPGLPATYAAAAGGEDEAVFDMAAHALAGMPAAIQSQVKPYLVRPTDATSVFHGPGTTSVVGDPFAAIGPAPIDLGAPDPATLHAARMAGVPSARLRCP